MKLETPEVVLVELMANADPRGIKARIEGELAVVGLNVTLKGSHCDTAPFTANEAAGVLALSPVGKQDVLLEGSIFITSDTFPVLLPSPSSRDATKDVPAANGRNVIAAPLLEPAFHEVLGMGIFWILVEAKGMTVNESGSAGGA